MESYHGSSLSHFCLAERQLKQAVGCREAVAVDAIVARWVDIWATGDGARFGVILMLRLWALCYAIVNDLKLIAGGVGCCFVRIESA